MKINITLHCPSCRSDSIKKNGIKSDGKQNYRCKNCGRQFIGDHALRYKGRHSEINRQIRLMLVRGCGVRDIAVITGVSPGKVLSVLLKSVNPISPKRCCYDQVEIDELWTYWGKKKQRAWVVYTYSREFGEMIAAVWGRRDEVTVKRLFTRLKKLKIDRFYTDRWESFVNILPQEKLTLGKAHTVGIEGNNCRLRHRIRRLF